MPLPPGFTAIQDRTGEGRIVSFIGVIVGTKEPRRSRGTDWVLEFSLQDDFAAGMVGGSSTVTCRMFKSSLDKLPKISAPGDIAVVRNFRLSAWGMRLDCVSENKSQSGVLVFPASSIPIPELSQAYKLGNKWLPYNATFGLKGPTAQEQVAVIDLKYAASSSTGQVQQHAATTSFKALAPEKLSLIKDMDFNRFYDVRAQVVNVYYTAKATVELKITDYTANKNLFYYADPDQEDDYLVTVKGWKGPFGQLTLNVILWESNAIWGREHISVGDYVFLKNMRTKLSPANKLEGALHQDRERSHQVDIRKLIAKSDIEEIDKRREVYEKQHGNKSALEALRNVSAKPTTLASASSKRSEKRQKQRERKNAELMELEEKAKEWEVVRSGVNSNIKAAFPEMKLSTLSEIIYNPHLQVRTQKYNNYTLPFVNVKHRSRVRVVDVFPPEVKFFAHLTSDPKWNQRAKKQDQNSNQTKARWEWGFVLLLEDANLPPNTVSEKLRVVVGNDVGQGLLDQNAVDLEKNPRILKQLEERLFILWGNMLELKTELRDRDSDLPLPPGDNRLQNKPFDCCIEEYGYEVPITKANPAGYQRMHRLAQTFIMT
ncbi:hypothetical protein BKA66DRAFT_495872 [Pyrenochaeta sp. MPI-SDFR-AT-0127]|nr:hypothetical protein BKA66DRAFT_495872 [Pyrenochaeta sp. MPI-SDFR-AT-0127]